MAGTAIQIRGANMYNKVVLKNNVMSSGLGGPFNFFKRQSKLIILSPTILIPSYEEWKIMIVNKQRVN